MYFFVKLDDRKAHLKTFDAWKQHDFLMFPIFEMFIGAVAPYPHPHRSKATYIGKKEEIMMT